jgi:hypothetical protein
MLDVQEFYFNAAKLDTSIAIRTSDYINIVKPRVAEIREA